MRFGIALPHYDFSLPGRALTWQGVRDWARRAEDLGFDSVWMSDHLFWDLERYGGSEEPQQTLECFTTLAGLAVSTSRVRIGSLVACNDLRSPALLAKMAATLDVLSGGRVEIGIGAGWYEAEYQAAGLSFDPPAVRVSRLAEAVRVLTGMLSSDSFSFEGRHYRVRDAYNLPRSGQQPRPPVFVGGKGDRIASIAGRYADGYNTVWAWTPLDYRRRVEHVEGAASKAGRDPASIRKTVGLYCLPGSSSREIDARWRSYKDAAQGVGPSEFEEWKRDKLAGDSDDILARIAEFEAAGAEEVILGFGLIPFQIADPPAVEWFAREVIPQGGGVRG